MDFGPSMATGRVADLSPGLADALDLDTNDECSLEIPLPEAGLLVGIDLKAIDKVTFTAPGMTRTLVAATSAGKAIYWVTGLVGTVEAGQTLMRKVGDNEPEVLLNATTVFPVIASDQVSAATAAELNKVLPKNPGYPSKGRTVRSLLLAMT